VSHKNEYVRGAPAISVLRFKTWLRHYIVCRWLTTGTYDNLQAYFCGACAVGAMEKKRLYMANKSWVVFNL